MQNKGNLQVWLTRWGLGDEEPAPAMKTHEGVDGHAALFAAGAVVRRCSSGGPLDLNATNALVGGVEGVLVYALHSPWAAFVPRLRLRGGAGSHPALGAAARAVEAVC